MINFSDRQQKTIANALTILSLMVVVLFVVLVGWMLLKVLSFASPAITPVIVGLFLSLFFKPYYSWCIKMVRNPSVAMLIVFGSVFVPLGLLLWYGGSFVADQISSLIAQAPIYAEKVVEWVNKSFPKAKELGDIIGIPYEKWVEIYKIKAIQVGVGVLGSASKIGSFLVGLIFFFYFLTRPSMVGKDYVKHLPFLKTDTKSFVANQIDSFLDIVVSFFQRQVVICIIEGLLYGTGLAIVGVPYGFLLGLVLGILNLVPLLGTVLCLPIILTFAYFGADGSMGRLICATVVWAIGQVLDGYYITPKIQGNKTGLGYAGVIFSFFFWGAVFQSLLGLLLAIPLSAFCVVLWRAVKAKYIKPVV